MANLKFAGLASTVLKSNFSRLNRPYKLNFAITYWCQSRCLTCNIWQMKPKDELRIDEIREFAKKNGHFKWIEITGGEPFLRSDIVEIVKAFHEGNKGLYLLTMPTNSLCSKDMVLKKLEEIAKTGIPKIVITISLDGYREMHDKVRGVPGNYDRAIGMFKGIKELSRTYRNLSVVFGYTISRFNQGSLPKTVASVMGEVEGITPNDFHINLGQLSSNYYGNSGIQVAPDNSAIVEEIGWLMKTRKFSPSPMIVMENMFIKKLADFARTGKQPMRSRSLEASLFLDSFGNVYPSIMWDRKVGNIRDCGYDLLGLWHNEIAEEVRSSIKNGKEPSQWTACEAYQSIGGGVLKLIK